MKACDEIKTYFGVVITMGKMNLPEARDYWHKVMFNIPCFSEICTVTSFDNICRLIDNNYKRYHKKLTLHTSCKR